MIRNEAQELTQKAHWNIDNPISEIRKIVDEIYDDFEKQQLENLAYLQMANSLIEKLQSRTCEGCKYSNIAFDGGNMELMVNDCRKLNIYIYDYKDFNCSEWRAKDAN